MCRLFAQFSAEPRSAADFILDAEASLLEQAARSTLAGLPQAPLPVPEGVQ